MEKYYLIHNSEGDTTVDELTDIELLERLAENYYGDNDFHDKIPNDNDTNYWGMKMLVIKGEVITPEPKEVVTSYKLK